VPRGVDLQRGQLIKFPLVAPFLLPEIARQYDLGTSARHTGNTSRRYPLHPERLRPIEPLCTGDRRRSACLHRLIRPADLL
jgi:hypothetical protein